MERHTIVFFTTIIIASALVVTSLVSLNNINKELTDRCTKFENELMARETMLANIVKNNTDIEKNVNHWKIGMKS